MWRNYLVTALRHLERNRVYAAISIASLTLGFAAAILVGIFVRAELSYDRFLPDYGRLYFARQTLFAPAHGGPWVSNETRIDIASDLKADFPQIEAVTRIQPHSRAVEVGGTVYAESDTAWGDPNLLEVLKLPLVAGERGSALMAPDSLVLTQTLARKYFGDADPIGRTLVLHDAENGQITGALGTGRAYRVTAVLRDLPLETHLKAQIFTLTEPEALDDPPNPYGQEALTYVRLAPGATAASVNRQMPAFVARHIPLPLPNGGGFALTLAPLSELHLPRTRLNDPGDINPYGDRTILATTAAVALLILVTAAINFVGLTTSRSAQRAVEVGVRKAVGARRRDLVAQFIAEALVQAMIAFLLALAIGELATPALGGLLGHPLSLDYARDVRFLGLLAASAVGVGVLAGLYPALVLSGLRPAPALRGGPGAATWSAGARGALVIAQFAVLVLLMVVTVTVWRQTRLQLDRALSVQGQNVLVINGRPLCAGGFEERVRALPGVRGAACSANVVFLNNGAESSAHTVAGQPLPIELGPVEPGFFAFFGVRPLAGREFDPRRPGDAPLGAGGGHGDNPPVVLNATAARLLGFASPQAAVGRTVRWERLSAPFVNGEFRPHIWQDVSEVLGVVPDYAGTSRVSMKPMIYWVDPDLEATLSVRIDGAAIPSTMRAINALWRRDGHFAAPDAKFLDAKVERAFRDLRILDEIAALSAAVALVLAATGLFGLASYASERRTKEFGVRKAMGADALDIAGLLLWQLSQPVLAAAAIGAPLGYLAARWWLQGFAERVSLGPATFFAVTLTVIVIAWITVITHTWRVARTRPVAALRYE